MRNVLDVLYERGFVQQISDEEQLHRRLEQPLTLYWGFDATATSFHQGNLVSLMMLSWFQRYGHRPIALAGGGTTLVGDPSGRTTSRPMLTEEQIDQNLDFLKRQAAQFVDFSEGRALLVNNADWLTRLNFVEFMRDIGTRFSLNEVLRLEAYRTRLEAGGMTFLELSYVLMQSYDFLYLYQHYDCSLQVGGSDQWGNSTMGADLIRRVTGDDAFVLVTPLITTSSGTKMGKTQTGSVWLDSSLTSPYDYFQHWRNTDDQKVEQALGVFTFLPMEEVRVLGRLEGAELNRAKEVLAFEATRIVHGEEEARKALEASRAVFGGGAEDENVPSVEIERARLSGGMSVMDLFKEAGLVASNNEARQMVKQGGLAINGEPVMDAAAQVDLSGLSNGHLMLSRGKKRHMRVVLR
ncbi:MAG TPA: tyrosine--tRNA ligase [Chloroflexota bacterium]